MNYNFSIQIDDDNHSLSSTNGISLQYLSELLKDLYNAIDLDEGSNCTLSKIRGNCYALDFNTEEEIHYNRFQIVHKNIENLPSIDLTKEEKKYANTLKKILGGQYYLRAYDKEKNVVASIKDLGKEKNIEFYYTGKTIYGIVSELGGKQLETSKKHIRIDGVDYPINISKETDMELKEYYGTIKLKIKIKQKRSVKTNRILSADLIDFVPTEDKSLSENLKEIGFVEFESIKGAKTIDDIIDNLYGNKK